MPGDADAADKARIADLYAGFNARELDRLLALMVPDVAWPNGMEGGYELGRDAVRAYWTRQWGMIDPQVTPQRVDRLDDGRLAVRVRQVIRDLAGAELRAGEVRHTYTLRGGLIARMDIDEA
ncbi:MAG: nuclear transport factor 2 family protein [Caulobacterales bacterium]|nr:nuclear transport factor 2 family protein [Caulobacterales bacterium]